MVKCPGCGAVFVFPPGGGCCTVCATSFVPTKFDDKSAHEFDAFTRVLSPMEDAYRLVQRSAALLALLSAPEALTDDQRKLALYASGHTGFALWQLGPETIIGELPSD